jgi:membrane protein DedA with SNARE-associated domain
MTLESFIGTYGYLAVVVGTFVEGETVLVMGGFAAHQGYMKLPWVIVSAFVGTLAGDQLFFFLGRLHGQTFLAKRPSWQVRADKVDKLLAYYKIPVLLGFRFLYGMRTVTPFVIGMSRVSTRLFILLNTASAAVWAVVVGTGGYLFGGVLQLVIGDIKQYEHEALLAIAFIGILIWSIHSYRRRLRKATHPGST